ncbi:MAG: ABC transporter ATP-binding protein, partial [bacterium]|nr:ABC transporter ATP-binding protein [bacterium]
MSDIAVKLGNLSKFYKLYDSPRDRLKEALHPFGKKLHKEFYALKDINLEIKK